MPETPYDPIAYPGIPLQDKPEPWIKLRRAVICRIDGQIVPAGQVARWTGSGWECRACVHPDWAPDTP